MRLMATGRGGGLDAPHRIAAAEIEADFGETRLQLVLAPDIFDLDPRFLAAERQQVDFADRIDRSQPIPHLNPLAQTGYGYRHREVRRLVGAGTPFCPRLEVRSDCICHPFEEVGLVLRRIGVE